MPPARSATAAMLLGAAAGCGVGAETPVVVKQFSPTVGYNDVALPATIGGSGFRPMYSFDTGPGSAHVDVGGFSATLAAAGPGSAPASFPLTAVNWESLNALGATVPAGIPAGPYDLILVAPGGQKSRLPAAFRSLGADTSPPAVAITAPGDGDIVGAGAALTVVVTASGGYGPIDGLRVSFASAAGSLPAHDCPLVAGATTASCTFTITAPAPAADPDMLLIAAEASGGGAVTTDAQIAVQLVPAPIPTGLSPGAGSTLGGTQVIISGTNIVPSATTVAFDGEAATVYTATPTTIMVLAPPHPPGAAKVTLTTGGATTALADRFTYLAPPVAREVSPASGPASGLIPVAVVGDNFTYTTAIIVGGGNPLFCPVLINANRIEGYLPPGMGTEYITAYDPIAGGQPDPGVPFLYLAPPDGSAGAVTTDAGTADAASPFGDGGCPGDGGP